VIIRAIAGAIVSARRRFLVRGINGADSQILSVVAVHVFWAVGMLVLIASTMTIRF